jgi:hypothetical protein
MPYLIAAAGGAVMAALLLTLFSIPGLLGLSVVQTFGAMLSLVLLLVGAMVAAVLHAMSGLGRLV